jgi:hypothetical protein
LARDAVRPVRREAHERFTPSAIRRFASADRGRRPFLAAGRDDAALPVADFPADFALAAIRARRNDHDRFTASDIFFFASSDNFAMNTSGVVVFQEITNPIALSPVKGPRILAHAHMRFNEPSFDGFRSTPIAQAALAQTNLHPLYSAS